MAKQVILHSSDYPIRKAIFGELQQHCAGASRTIFPGADAPSPTYQAIHISEDLDSTSETNL